MNSIQGTFYEKHRIKIRELKIKYIFIK